MLYEGRVVRTGSEWTFVRLADGSQPYVRIRNANVAGQRPLQVEDGVILVGPLRAHGEGREARYAWPDTEPAPAHTAKYETGVIAWVAPSGSFGRVLVDGRDQYIFVHHTRTYDGQLRQGERVRFRVERSDKGEMAVDVQRLPMAA